MAVHPVGVAGGCAVEPGSHGADDLRPADLVPGGVRVGGVMARHDEESPSAGARCRIRRDTKRVVAGEAKGSPFRADFQGRGDWFRLFQGA